MVGLDRFIKAQEQDYFGALQEVKKGRKLTHWMWYIFPQLKGLGYSAMAEFYGIEGIEEAKEYIEHEVLGKRLIEISDELLKLNTNNSIEVFGEIDSLKLKSCMTLFDYVSENDVFDKVLQKFYNGEKDLKTIGICNKKNNKNYTK